MKSFRIRAATAADAQTIYDFICALAHYEREPEAVVTTPEVLRDQLSSMPPPFECLLAETGESAPKAVGFALFFQNYSTWLGKPGLYLEDLFVLPEHRGDGVGRALFTECARIAKGRGYGRYEWAALNWNTPAIEFYEAFGAQALSEWTTFRLTGSALARVADAAGNPGV